MADTSVELEAITEDVMLLSDTNAISGPKESDKRKIQLIRMHLEEDGTSVVSLDNIFKRDFVSATDRKRYEGFLNAALEECKMDRHDFTVSAGTSYSCGAVERECKIACGPHSLSRILGTKNSKTL